MAGGPSTLRQRDIRTSKPKYVFRSNQNFTIYRRRERNSSKPNEIKHQKKSSSYPVQNCSKPKHILRIDNEIFYFHSSSKLLFVRPKRLRGRTQCCQVDRKISDSSNRTPKKLVNQCCYLPPTTRAFIFFRRKTPEKIIKKKCEAAFEFEVMCGTFFACLCARFRHFLRFPDVIYLQPSLLRMWWHPIFPVYWCACVCLCAFVCAQLCAGKRKKKMALTQIPPEEKFYTSMPWWQLC